MAPLAAFNLGGLLAGKGDMQGAKDAYQKAIDSGTRRCSSDGRGSASGRCWQRKGDVQGAKDAYQKAIDSGHADAAPMAADNLAALLNKQ